MTDKPRILCVGHSHLSAVFRAYQDNYRAGDWNFDFDFLRLQAEAYQPNVQENAQGETVLSDLILRHLRHKTVVKPADVVLGQFYGNEINAIGMLRHKPGFDFHVPGDDSGVDPDAEIVPFGALRDMVSYRVDDKVMRFVHALRGIYDGPVYIAPPPPPIPDEAHILAHPGGFRELAKERGVSPAPLRLKLWRLYVTVLTEKVEAAGAKVLPVAAEAFDDDGYFKSDYWHWDPTHGNFAYGDVVIRYLLREVLNITPERIAS